MGAVTDTEALEVWFNQAIAEPTEEWHEERQTFIGGSDAAPTLNLSPWSTPYHVFCEKVFGIRKPDEPALAWGRILEPVIRRYYQEFCGMEVRKPAKAVRRKGREWQAANLDAEREDERICEIKNVSMRKGWGAPGTDQIPSHYFLQGLHQMEVVETDVMDFAVLISGNDFRVYELRHDKPLARIMTEAEQVVWAAVEAKEAPDPSWDHPETLDMIKRMCIPTPEASLNVPVGDERWQWLREYVNLGKQIGDLEKLKKEYQARILHAMDTHSTMLCQDGSGVKRVLVKRANPYYQFRPFGVEDDDAEE